MLGRPHPVRRRGHPPRDEWEVRQVRPPEEAPVHRRPDVPTKQGSKRTPMEQAIGIVISIVVLLSAGWLDLHKDYV